MWLNTRVVVELSDLHEVRPVSSATSSTPFIKSSTGGLLSSEGVSGLTYDSVCFCALMAPVGEAVMVLSRNSSAGQAKQAIRSFEHTQVF